MAYSISEKYTGNAVSKGDRIEIGMRMQKKHPWAQHGQFSIRERPEVAAILAAQDRHRIRRLLPTRYERMASSPFAFYRGSAAVMAAGLHQNSSSGIALQLCGDCHLLNFGGFATPERKLVFDINDFDETSRAPWEWDLKRLAASFHIAAREKKLSEIQASEAVWNMADSYRRHLREYSEMSALQLWYSQISLKDIAPEGRIKNLRQFDPKKAMKAIVRAPHEREFEKLAIARSGSPKIKDDLPLLFHATPDGGFGDLFTNPEIAYDKYLKSLSHDRRQLLGRYRLQDVAVKVVGIGSVGTRCGVLLLLSATGEPLFLQFKEAVPSILEPYSGSRYSNAGRRVVEGQKLIQAAADIFLGWTRDASGRHYYVRQLKDAKLKPALDSMDAQVFERYASSCGWALARAHSRTGDPSLLTGYLGDCDAMPDAMTAFAKLYAQQNAADYEVLLKAMKSGRIEM